MVTVMWDGKMRFVATRDQGQSPTMDAGPNSGGEGDGFTPVELILTGLEIWCGGGDFNPNLPVHISSDFQASHVAEDQGPLFGQFASQIHEWTNS